MVTFVLSVRVHVCDSFGIEGDTFTQFHTVDPLKPLSSNPILHNEESTLTAMNAISPPTVANDGKSKCCNLPADLSVSVDVIVVSLGNDIVRSWYISRKYRLPSV